MKDRQKAPTRGRLFYCKIAINVLRYLLPFLEELFDDAVYLPSLKVVFVRLNMDSEQAGAVGSEFVANIVEGIVCSVGSSIGSSSSWQDVSMNVANSRSRNRL